MSFLKYVIFRLLFDLVLFVNQIISLHALKPMNIEATDLRIHVGYKVGDSLSDALQLTMTK